MSWTVLEPGLHSLAVDLGRTGSRARGVPLGGAADRFAYQLGNLLLGNQPDAVAVEVTLKGPTLRVEIETVAVVFGAPFEVTVNGREVAPNTSFRLAPGDLLRIGGTPTACRAYLCVVGGFECPAILGSRSALEPLRAGDVLGCRTALFPPAGGRGIVSLRVPSSRRGRGEGDSSTPPLVEGRSVAKQPGGESFLVSPKRERGTNHNGASCHRVPIVSRPLLARRANKTEERLPSRRCAATSPQRGEVFQPALAGDNTAHASLFHSPSPLPPGEGGTRKATILRALPGPQMGWFPDGGFFDRPFTVAPASNRMGVRLLGEPIPKRPGELPSEPVAPGAVQVTNDGLPVVLGVDGQTIGGYPKVAHVIRADQDTLGQLRPGDGVRFTPVTMAEAEAAAAERTRELRLWKMRLELLR